MVRWAVTADATSRRDIFETGRIEPKNAVKLVGSNTVVCKEFFQPVHCEWHFATHPSWQMALVVITGLYAEFSPRIC